MYLPKHFDESTADRAIQLIRENPFATLITFENGSHFANHLPLIVETPADGSLRLIGHMARRNPQWRHFSEGLKPLVIFHGPHTYITPKWYAENDVPTWNYAVVHAQGATRLIEDFDGLVDLLKKSAETFEASDPAPWKFFLPDDLKDPSILTRAIVGFEISVESFEAKFKLSQNRSAEDRTGVISGLASRKDEMSASVRKLMES